MNVSSLKCSMVHTKMTNATCYSENRISQNRMMVINANKLLSFLQFEKTTVVLLTLYFLKINAYSKVPNKRVDQISV